MQKTIDAIFQFFSGRAVGVVVKFVIAWTSQPVVVSALDKAGIHLDQSKFQTWLLIALLWLVERVHHLYDEAKQRNLIK